MGDEEPSGETEAGGRYDVLIVGAGIAGLDAAYRLQSEHPGRTYAILEGRATLGGTWDLFRYPGVRSDSDMATLSFPFRPWRGETALGAGEAIREYLVDTAQAFGIDRHIRFNHRVVGAEWSSEAALWTLTIRAGERLVTSTCGFLFSCSGYFDYAQGHAPTWPGAETFAGQVVHPQFWPQDLDYTGKRVVVIGSGATAVTLAPALAETAAHVTILQRSPSYVVARPGRDRVAASWRRRLPAPVANRLVRWKNIATGAFFFKFARRKPEQTRRMIREGVRRALGPEYDVDRHFNPTYEPWDQRLCLTPDGALFKAIRAGKASMVTDAIEAFTPKGLKLASGHDLEADIVVSATGLRLQMFGGVALKVDGAPVNVSERLVYKGMMVEGVPNFAFSFGYSNVSWTLKCDLTARFVCRLLRHMGRRGRRMVTPRLRDPSVAREPIVGLRSGYVRRAATVLPMQGPYPWRSRKTYVRDYVSVTTGRLNDGVLRFDERPSGARASQTASPDSAPRLVQAGRPA